MEKEAEFAKQREEYEKKHDAQMAAMYEKLEKQLMELKSASNGRGAEAELRKQLLVMKQQAETLKQENTQMRSALLQMPQKGVGGHDNVNAKIAALEKYIEKLEQNADKGLLYQVRSVLVLFLFRIFCLINVCQSNALSNRCVRWKREVRNYCQETRDLNKSCRVIRFTRRVL